MDLLDGVISIVALSIVATLCVIGVFHPRFDDTLGQRIGMSIIGSWCLLRIPVKFGTFDTEPVHLLLHIGMAFYACGTALKAWRKYRSEREQLMHRIDDMMVGEQ